MRVVIALGGNALLQRGEALTAEQQNKNAQQAAQIIASIAKQHQIILCHGNGPQVGMLALWNHADPDAALFPLDSLVACTQGMIGYTLQQALHNVEPTLKATTLTTQVEVDPNDPAFQNPTKFIGPVYTKENAETLAKQHHWFIKPDGDYYRRVVASPRPSRIIESDAIQALLKQHFCVICNGGGGIPVIQEQQQLKGVQAVIDKDASAALLAKQLNADQLIILTDVDYVYEDWGSEHPKPIQTSLATELAKRSFASGSMGPKVAAACDFTQSTGNPSLIASLDAGVDILEKQMGTLVT